MIFNIYVCTDLYFHGKSSVMAITNWEAAPTSNKGRRNRGAREDLGLPSIFKYVLHRTYLITILKTLISNYRALLRENPFWRP